MRFLRGHFYFLLKILFNQIPYVDETLQKSAASYGAVSNVALTSDELWTKIANDFKFAASNLPVTQSQVGRATKGAAQAYYAKTMLYQAYTQDAMHNVTGIDQTKLAQVVTYCDSVINSVSDILSMAIGFVMASRVNTRVIVALTLAMELFVGWAIRDNLTLNILMLIHPTEAVREWQAGR